MHSDPRSKWAPPEFAKLASRRNASQPPGSAHSQLCPLTPLPGFIIRVISKLIPKAHLQVVPVRVSSSTPQPPEVRGTYKKDQEIHSQHVCEGLYCPTPPRSPCQWCRWDMANLWSSGMQQTWLHGKNSICSKSNKTAIV